MPEGIEQAPGACGCGGCTATIHVTGCGGLDLAGATVTIKDAGGTTLDSGTTDGSGLFTTTRGVNNATVIVAMLRGATKTTTGLNLCPGGATIAMAAQVSSGYHCSGCCALPLADTLYFTDILGNTCTLTWSSGTTWAGSATFFFPPCGSPICPGSTQIVSITLTNCRAIMSFLGNFDCSCPDAGVGVGCTFGNSGGGSCPPSVSLPQHFVTGGFPQGVYCGVASGSVWATVTE